MNNGYINSFTFMMFFAFLLLAFVIGIMDTMLVTSIDLAEDRIIKEFVEPGSVYEKRFESFLSQDIFNLISIIDLINWFQLMMVSWLGGYAFKFGWNLTQMPMGAILTRQMFGVMVFCFVLSLVFIYISEVFLTQLIGPLYAYIWDDMWMAQLYINYIFVFYLSYHILVILGNKMRHLRVVQKVT